MVEKCWLRSVGGEVLVEVVLVVVVLVVIVLVVVVLDVGVLVEKCW